MMPHTPSNVSHRYHPISRHYRQRFGCKVYKISVAAAQSCPNREGIRGMRVCAFCDPWGSAAYGENTALPLGRQIETVRSPKAVHSLMSKLKEIFEFEFDLSALEKDADNFDNEINDVVAKDPNVAAYVRELKKREFLN